MRWSKSSGPIPSQAHVPIEEYPNIGGPDAPRGTVPKFYHMASVVLLDVHRRPPGDGSGVGSLGRRNVPYWRVLKRLLGRSANALTNFFANVGIVLRATAE
jgi:hypothetical protein